MKIYSEYSYWWLLFFALLSLIVAYLQYHYKIKSSVFSKQTRFVLSVIRFFLLFVISILLLNFYSKFLKNEYIKPVLILAVDNSQSMISAKDSNEVKEFFTNKFSKIKEALTDKFDIQTITFGEKILFNNDSISFKELKTNPENLFTATQQALGNKPVNAMILISDGIFNEGIQPISLINTIQYPIYTIGTGDTNIYRDIYIKKIFSNKNVFIGNDFIAEILVKSANIKNEKTKISIYEGKQLIAEKEINILSDNNNLISTQFQLSAEKGGHHTYKVVLSPVSDEKNLQNNTAYFVVNVIENKTKILIVYSAPHPDITAIKQVLNAFPQYEAETYPDKEFTKEISKYDLVIYHSPTLNSQQVFNKCLNASVPAFIINPSLTLLQNKLVAIKQISAQYNEIETYFNSSFSAFSVTDEYKNIASELPVIIAPYGYYAPLGEADILYYQKINNVMTDIPLFYFTQTSFGKYAVFLGDGLWRWKMQNYLAKKNTEWFSHLIVQTIRYLSVKRDKNPFKVIIPANINENEPLQVTAEFYNETMQPITEPDVFISLKNENNNEYKFVFNKSSSNYFLNAGILPPGEYQYKAHTQYKGKDYTQSGKIHIIPMSVEKNDLIAQHQMLKTLSSATSGKFYLLKDAENVILDLNQNEDIKTIIVQNETYQYWIDNQWWFVIILILALSEWLIRRWNGVI